MQPDNLTPADEELARVLGGLRPAATGIDRDTLMFAAGRASTQRRVRAWQGLSAAAATLLVVALVVPPRAMPTRVTVERPRQTPGSERIAARPAPTPAEADAVPLVDASYLKLRNAVLARGVDVLTPPASPARRAPVPSPSPRDWRGAGPWIGSRAFSGDNL